MLLQNLPFRPEILEMLNTPITWAIVEILSIILFSICVRDAFRNNEERIRLYRVLELFGYVIYAGIFENIGVLTGLYNYSLDRILMVGVVPLEILLIEGAIFYAAMRFAEKRHLPNWATPFVVGLLCVLQDLTIDPAAVFDTYLVAGIPEGQWNWDPHYAETLFGIPFYNFTGWFMMMFFYASMLVIGRKLFERSGYKPRNGMLYVILAPLLSLGLLVCPLNPLILFGVPFVPFFDRTAEIIGFSIVMTLSVIVVIKTWKSNALRNWKEEKVVWGIPLVLHLWDIIIVFALQIEIAYLPVLLFGAIHIIYLGYYLRSRSQNPPAAVVN